MSDQNNQQQNQSQNNGQQGNNQQSNGQQQNQNQQEKLTWEKYLEGQPEDVKKLYTEHTTGLQNSVKATRDERDDLAKQIKDLLPKAEKGSELEKTLNEALGKLELADKKTNFIEQAIKPEIGCRNVKAAFALATASELFKKNGDPDWEAIKKEAPELFGAAIPEGNAGSGGEQQPPKTNEEFNAELRRRANS